MSTSGRASLMRPARLAARRIIKDRFADCAPGMAFISPSSAPASLRFTSSAKSSAASAGFPSHCRCPPIRALARPKASPVRRFGRRPVPWCRLQEWAQRPGRKSCGRRPRAAGGDRAGGGPLRLQRGERMISGGRGHRRNQLQDNRYPPPSRARWNVSSEVSITVTSAMWRLQRARARLVMFRIVALAIAILLIGAALALSESSEGIRIVSARDLLRRRETASASSWRMRSNN